MRPRTIDYKILEKVTGKHHGHMRRLKQLESFPRKDLASHLSDWFGMEPYHFMWPERYGNPWPVIEAHWPEVEAYLKARISGESPDLPPCLAAFGQQPEAE